MSGRGFIRNFVHPHTRTSPAKCPTAPYRIVQGQCTGPLQHVREAAKARREWSTFARGRLFPR